MPVLFSTLTHPNTSVNPSGSAYRLDGQRLSDRASPVFLNEITEGQEPVGLGSWAQEVIASCMPQGELGFARNQMTQRFPAMPLAGLGRRLQKAEIALAPAARIGPHLPGATRRASHFVFRLNRHTLIHANVN